MMPRLDSLQKEFDGKIQILGVAYQSEKEVNDFFQRSAENGIKRPKLPDVLNDNVLINLFPHTYLPHFVWINSEGIVAAVTEDGQVNPGNIQKVLSKAKWSIPEKKDEPLQPYNNHLPLFINNNATSGNHLIYHSLLTGFVEGLQSGLTQYPLDSLSGLKITARNVPLLWLFRTAYQERKVYYGKNRMIIAAKDSSKLINNSVGAEYLNWLKDGNGFCYELVVPPVLAGRAYSLMQRDLALFFDEYKVEIKQRTQVCWVLTRTDKKVHFNTSGGTPASSYNSNGFKLHNAGLSNFIDHLNVIYMQDSPYPVLDETNIKQPVDMEVTANLSDIGSLNHALAAYGLTFIKVKRTIPVLAISDNIKPN